MTAVLLTGASGFVGRFMGTLLKHDDIDVFPYSLRYKQDIRDYEQLRAYVGMVQPDEIHHLAAQPYVPETTTNPKRGYDINVIGTLNLLEAVRHTGQHPVIHIAGTSEEYGYSQHGDLGTITEQTVPRPDTLYGASKLAATNLALAYARTYDLHVVVTRAWNHTGPSQPSTYAIPSFARKIAEVEHGRRDIVTHGNLSAWRAYMDVRDVISAYRAAIELPTGIYNIGPREIHPMQHYLDLLVEISGADITTGMDESLYRPGLQRGGKDVIPMPNSDLFRSLTDWDTHITIEDMLREVLMFWRGVST